MKIDAEKKSNREKGEWNREIIAIVEKRERNRGRGRNTVNKEGKGGKRRGIGGQIIGGRGWESGMRSCILGM